MTRLTLREKITAHCHATIEACESGFPVSALNEARAMLEIINAHTRAQTAPDALPVTNQNYRDRGSSDVDPVASAFDACQIIDEAVLAGHDNMNDLVLHLLVALAPARAALSKGAVGGSKEGQS